MPAMPCSTTGTEAMNECDCEQKTCMPENNEGRRCWRSGFAVPVGYFTNPEVKRIDGCAWDLQGRPGDGSGQSALANSPDQP